MLKSVLLLTLSLGATAPAADFWQIKSPETWTDSEVQKLRQNSPWAMKQPQERRVKTTVENAQSSQVKISKGKAPKQPKGTRTTWDRIADAQIRWESATPMRAAAARLDPRWAKALEVVVKDHYVVTVSGLVLSDELATPDAAVKELQAQSVFQVGDRVMRPDFVRAIDSGSGLFYAIEFTRDGTLEQSTKSIEFKTHLGNTRLSGTFTPKHMGFQGRAAL
jgi:hypothetical protein